MLETNLQRLIRLAEKVNFAARDLQIELEETALYWSDVAAMAKEQGFTHQALSELTGFMVARETFSRNIHTNKAVSNKLKYSILRGLVDRQDYLNACDCPWFIAHGECLHALPRRRHEMRH